MSYQLQAITMKIDMSPESMAQVAEVWGDIGSGKLPLMYTSTGEPIKDALPITEYMDYSGVNNNEPCTMQIRVVGPHFFGELNERAAAGEFLVFENSADTIPECSEGAWNKVHGLELDGKLKIDYSYAIESTVPAEYTQDGHAHCTLYVKPIAE